MERNGTERNQMEWEKRKKMRRIGKSFVDVLNISTNINVLSLLVE